MAGSERYLARLKDISKKLAKEKTKSKDQQAAEKKLNAAIAQAAALVAAADKLEDSRKKLAAVIEKHNAGVTKFTAEVREASALAAKQAKVDGPLRASFLEAGPHLTNLANNLPKVDPI